MYDGQTHNVEAAMPNQEHQIFCVFFFSASSHSSFLALFVDYVKRGCQ